MIIDIHVHISTPEQERPWVMDFMQDQYEGDIYALLGSSAKTKAFDVEVPGVSTDSRSTDFWVSRAGRTTKIANFDDAEMVVSSGGSSVTLAKNQGALVKGARWGIIRRVNERIITTALIGGIKEVFYTHLVVDPVEEPDREAVARSLFEFGVKGLLPLP